jgi:hypothetical protein
MSELDDKQWLESELEKVNVQIAEISDTPDTFIQQRLNEIDFHLQRVPQKEAPKGTISMHTHLEQLKERIKADPIAEVSKKLDQLNQVKINLEAAIDACDIVEE